MKALAFYAKYPEELDTIYDRETESDCDAFLPPGIEEQQRDHMLKMVDNVYDQIKIETKKFLEKCMNEIIECLQHTCNIKPLISRSYTWHHVEAYLWKKKAQNKKKVQLGVNIITHRTQLFAITWIWVRGGQRIEDDLARIFGDSAQPARKIYPNWESGTVAITQTQIGSNALDSEESVINLCKKIVLPFRDVDQQQIEKILELTAG